MLNEQVLRENSTCLFNMVHAYIYIFRNVRATLKFIDSFSWILPFFVKKNIRITNHKFIEIFCKKEMNLLK
jgi:hypothetical protein